MNRKPIALAIFIGMAGISMLDARNWSVQSALARALASNSELLFAREQLRLQERVRSLAILGAVPKESVGFGACQTIFDDFCLMQGGKNGA